MCDFATQQLVQQTVSDRVQKNEMFTAFDVTVAVRKQISARVYHNDVKKEVHKLYDSGVMGPDYTRSMAVNLNVNPQPFLYHPMSADPTEYGQQNPPQVNTNVTSSDNNNDEEEDEDDLVEKTYKVDARQTLCIPALFLRQVGFKDGDTAYISVDGMSNSLLITKKTTPNLLSTYTVDYHGNVRITQFILQRGGIGGKKFNIDGDTNKVIIKKS
jgi:hypothetical protein